jgi:hypothetical protein
MKCKTQKRRMMFFEEIGYLKYSRKDCMVADLCHSCFSPHKKSRINKLKWQGAEQKYANKPVRGESFINKMLPCGVTD